jgi:hypothetical protein
MVIQAHLIYFSTNCLLPAKDLTNVARWLVALSVQETYDISPQSLRRRLLQAANVIPAQYRQTITNGKALRQQMQNGQSIYLESLLSSYFLVIAFPKLPLDQK